MKKYYTIEDLFRSKRWEDLVDNLNYDEEKVVEAILEIKYWQYDPEKKATFYTIDDLETAIDDLDNTTYYMDDDAYFDCMDDLLIFQDPNSVEARYFDYDAYHHDCMYDVTEASNGVILADW